MLEQKKLTRINIFHISTRKQDAEMLCSKYSNSGADVTLIEVADDIGTKLHIGKLYYFSKKLADRIFANSLFLDLQDIELVLPQYVQLEQSHSMDFAIWIVRKPKSQTISVDSNNLIPKQIESIKPEISSADVVLEMPKTPSITVTPNIELVKCPNCNSRVRSDRLEKHLRKAHGSNLVYRKSILYYGNSRSNGFAKNSCRHCGRPAIYGDDTCYSCNPK